MLHNRYELVFLLFNNIFVVRPRFLTLSVIFLQTNAPASPAVIAAANHAPASEDSTEDYGHQKLRLRSLTPLDRRFIKQSEDERA